MAPTSVHADMLLTARMGFVARDNKPVRTARLTERATKFRKAAACSTWNDKTGSAEIRQAIVNLLPPGATNTRSLGGYLSKSQLDMLYNVNRGTAGNRARKTAREARAAQAPAANLVGQSSQTPAARPRKTKTVSSNSRRTVNTTVSIGQRDNSQGQSGSVPRGENKRSRDHTTLDLAVQNTSPPLAKRPRPEESLGGAAETDYLLTEPQAPKRGADEAFFEDTDAGFDIQEKKRQKIRLTMGTVIGSLASTQRNSCQAIDPAAMLSTGHNKRMRTNTRIPAPLAPTYANDDANNPFNSPDCVFSPQSLGYDHANDEYINSVDSLHRNWFLPSSQQPTKSNANSRLKRATHASVGARGTEASRQEHEIQINKRPTTVGAGHSQPYPNTSQDQTSKTSHQTCKRSSGGNASPSQPYLKPFHTQTCQVPSQTNKQTSVSRAAFQQRFFSTSTSETPQIDDLINYAQDNGSVPDHHMTNNVTQDTRGPSTAKTVPIIDPGKDDAFQAECMAGITRHDYRYFHPNLDNESPDETISLRSALDLTRIDLMLKTGQDFPAELADKYQDESYATQHWRLQKHFEAIWHGPGSAPMLYRLEKDFFGWNTWPAVIDQLGQWLYDTAHEKGWLGEEL